MWRLISQISLFKTLRFNFHYFCFSDAIKFPVLISRKVILKRLGGKIDLPHTKIRSALIRIGFESVGIFDRRTSKGIWESSKEGEVKFHGSAYFGTGSKISICGGRLEIGNNFAVTANSSIVCKKNIIFGDNCLVSWDCLFMDTDFHQILYKGRIQNEDKKISIGNHVWIGCRTTILKGASIPDGSIIAAGSLVCGNLHTTNAIYGGSPLRILNDSIRWDY